MPDEYPKNKFSLAGKAELVANEEAEAKLEGEWFDSLRDMGIETCPQAPTSVSMAEMIPNFTPPVPAAEGSSGGRD